MPKTEELKQQHTPKVLATIDSPFEIEGTYSLSDSGYIAVLDKSSNLHIYNPNTLENIASFHYGPTDVRAILELTNNRILCCPHNRPAVILKLNIRDKTLTMCPEMSFCHEIIGGGGNIIKSFDGRYVAQYRTERRDFSIFDSEARFKRICKIPATIEIEGTGTYIHIIDFAFNRWVGKLIVIYSNGLMKFFEKTGDTFSPSVSPTFNLAVSPKELWGHTTFLALPNQKVCFFESSSRHQDTYPIFFFDFKNSHTNVIPIKFSKDKFLSTNDGKTVFAFSPGSNDIFRVSENGETHTAQTIEFPNIWPISIIIANGNLLYIATKNQILVYATPEFEYNQTMRIITTTTSICIPDLAQLIAQYSYFRPEPTMLAPQEDVIVSDSMRISRIS